MSEHIAATIESLFVNRFDAYARQLPNGQYIAEKQPLTPDIIRSHLRGEITVGAYQLNKQNQVKELVFDIDPTHNNEPLETAKKLVEASLDKKRFYKKAVWLEASRYPDPSFHVRLLFAVPVPAAAARWIGAKLLTDADVNPSTIELFPKQTKIDENGYGNCIKLPLGFHQKEHKWSRFLDLETLEPLPNEAIVEAAGISFSLKELEKIVTLAQAPTKIQTTLSKKVYKKTKRVRPCILEALNADLRTTKEHHLMRLAIAVEYLANKYSIDEVTELFKPQRDFDSEKTKKQLEHAEKKGYKPFTCTKIKEMGFCLGEACPIFRANERKFEKAVEALL